MKRYILNLIDLLQVVDENNFIWLAFEIILEQLQTCAVGNDREPGKAARETSQTIQRAAQPHSRTHTFSPDVVCARLNMMALPLPMPAP